MTNPINSKKCSKCGEEKPFADFSPHAHGKHGLQPRCKACHSAANSARYHARGVEAREESRLRAAAFRANNPEKDRETKRKWAEANREKSNASKAAWRERNPEANQLAKDNWRKANQEAVNAQGKAWKKANPEAMLRFRLSKYGLTSDDFRAMLASQSNRCAICVGPFTEKHGPCIDHCHRSTKVRALLCVRCNAGIGSFLERPEVLEAAARYLRKHNGTLK